MSDNKKISDSRRQEASPGDDVPGNGHASAKKGYEAPRLTIYGSIDKLTRTGGRTTRDGGRGRRRH